MRETRDIVCLGDVCHIIGGGTPSKKNDTYYSGSIPWATVRDMNAEVISETDFRITKEAVQASSTNIIPAGNVVIATRVGLGKVCLLSGDTAINQDLRGIIPKQPGSLLPRYLFYWFKTIAPHIISAGTGATVQGVKGNFVKSLRFPLPPLPEQKRIVAILDEAFAGIATAVANTEKNLANARELFESYLNAVFTQKEEGWAEKKLGDIATFRNGLNFTKNSKGELIKIVGVKDFQNDFWVPMDQLQSVRIDGELSELDALQNGDILTVRSNGNKDLIGRCILADQVPDKISHSGFTIRIRIKTDEVYHPYIVHFLKSKESRKQLTEISGGVNISSLNQQGLSSLMISYPSFSDQKTIVAKIDDLAAETERLAIIYQHKLTTLAELKQSLLHKAFSGALTSQSVSVLQEAVA